MLVATGCTPEGDPFPGFLAPIPGVDSGMGPGPVGNDSGPMVVEAGNGCVLLLPLDSATLQRLVGTNLTEIAPVGDLIQSAFFAGGPGSPGTFRRGFVEFEVPSGLPFGTGTLFLQEWSGVLGPPVDPVAHELVWYLGDGAITIGDYDAFEGGITSIMTDANDGNILFAIDVLDQVVATVGTRLGFRVKMAIDPAVPNDPGIPGTEFLGLDNNTMGPRIEMCP